jgi:hypothetical protein
MTIARIAQDGQSASTPLSSLRFSIFKQPNDVIAPRNDVDTPSHSRGAMRPGFAMQVLPSEIRGRRECRARDAPAALRAK